MVANHLSRFPSEEDPMIQDEFEFLERFIYTVDRGSCGGEIKIAQREDPLISNALRQLNYKGFVSEGRLERQTNLRIEHDLLYRGHQVVAPKSLHQSILLSFHNWVMQESTGPLRRLVRDIFGLQCGKMLNGYALRV